jgi:hypothetical protein
MIGIIISGNVFRRAKIDRSVTGLFQQFDEISFERKSAVIGGDSDFHIGKPSGAGLKSRSNVHQNGQSSTLAQKSETGLLFRNPVSLGMGRKGLEPSRSREREILSLLRLPFRHRPAR